MKKKHYKEMVFFVRQVKFHNQVIADFSIIPKTSI